MGICLTFADSGGIETFQNRSLATIAWYYVLDLYAAKYRIVLKT